MDVVIDAVKNVAPIGSLEISSQHDFALNLLMCLGDDKKYTPLADFYRQQNRLGAAGRWFIISPIHWEATHNDAMIVSDGEAFQWTDRVARIWLLELSKFFAHDQCELIYLSPYQWLMKLPEDSPYPLIKSPNLNQMLHQSMLPCLQALDATLRWVRLHTELQMFLSSHPLNAGVDRTKTFNGVWIWGGGVFEPMFKGHIITDDPFIQSLGATQAMSFIDLDWRGLDDQTLFIIRSDAMKHLKQLEQINQKNTINWYWNDQAYQIRSMPWHKRIMSLWRK